MVPNIPLQELYHFYFFLKKKVELETVESKNPDPGGLLNNNNSNNNSNNNK